MSQTKRFAEDWLDAIKDYCNRMRNVHDNKLDAAGFKSVLDGLVTQVAHLSVSDEDTMDKLKNAKNANERFEILKTRRPDLVSPASQYQKLQTEYAKSYNHLQKLLDLKKQEQEAITWDHAKTLLYRVLTTVFIAFIIFMYHMAAYKMTGNTFLVNPFAFVMR